MKNIILLIMILSSFYTAAQQSIYDIAINDIQGNPINLSNYKGKYLLFVNVASECGFTSQYKELETLQQNYKEKLVVIATPCNQFGGQEPGTAKDIQYFCSKNYGITFLLTEKTHVKGELKHRLYCWLTEKERNGQFSSSVKWNFQKYLVSQNGELINYFYSITNPMSKKITSILNK